MMLLATATSAATADEPAVMVSLVSGLVGALIGALALAAVQGWQLLDSRRQSITAGRLIYIEILYNISSLESAVQSLPAFMAASTTMWERDGDRLIRLLGEDQAT